MTGKSFYYLSELIEFVNENRISREDIQKIYIDRYNVILIYWN